MTRSAGWWCAAVLGVVMGATAGCAYRMTSAYRDDIKTIAVPIFANSTFEHGMEVSLTDAVIKEIHRTTPWRVAPERSAQTTLRGSITGTRLRRLSRQRESGLGQQMAVVVTASFEWKENESGEVLLSRAGFRAADTFVPTRPAGERLGLGQQAAVERLAKAIVAELRSSW